MNACTSAIPLFMYFWVVSLAIPNNITLSMFLLLVLKSFAEIILMRGVIINLVNVFVTCSEDFC